MNRMNKWSERALAVGIFILCGLAYFWARSVVLPMLRGPDGHYTLADPDSFMRWRLVERALQGEAVRIRWINEDNAPYGRMNEWTSPMTILGVGFVRAIEKLGGVRPAQALEWGGLWIGPVVGFLSLTALGWLGWRAGGWSMAACWMVAWPVLEDVIQMTRCGHTDHDSLHQLLFICMIGGCLAYARRPSALGGALIGLASAVAMWSAGVESLVAWSLIAGLGVYEAGWLARDDKRAGFWRGWWIAGFVGTIAAWLLEFWPRVFHGRLELISVWHAVLWGVSGTLLECLGQRQTPERRKLLLVVAATGCIVIAAGATRGFDWQHLHILQDKRERQLTAGVSETQPFATGGFEVALKKAWWKYGLLPLGSLGLAYRFSSVGLRTRWLAVVLVVFLALMLWQMRWLVFFAPALVMTAGISVRHCWPERPWAGVGWIVLATLPPWFLAAKIHHNVNLVRGDSTRGPYVEMFALRAASDCLGQEAPGSIVLAAWDQGGVLAGLGKVRVIGSAYWSNLDGLTDTHTLFTTHSESRFFELARNRRVDFVLIPSPGRLERAVWQSWVALHGRPPTRAEAFGAYIWRVASNRELGTVPCQKLSSLEPDWRIVRLAAERMPSKE
jgi:hypothetical protein